MYDHIKVGDLVRILGLSCSNFQSLPVHLVVHKESENGFYCSCVFLLLSDKGKFIRFYANSSDPNNDIKLAFET
tara:strand:+ start:894 stop:1115 length:222 start_codon:yes stop_codon:yes gene_type:complete